MYLWFLHFLYVYDWGICMSDDEGNIGIITEEREQENEKRRLNKIVDKLEQRISTLEKVLASHAKCIGEMREEKKDE